MFYQLRFILFCKKQHVFGWKHIEICKSTSKIKDALGQLYLLFIWGGGGGIPLREVQNVLDIWGGHIWDLKSCPL